jgi:hypothetical protein
MKSDITVEQYNIYLENCKERYAIPKHKHAKKNPNVYKDMITMAQKDGLEFRTLIEILEKIKLIAGVPSN